MTITEIITKCREQQDISGEADAMVMFVLPGRWGKRNAKPLFPHGPKGEIIAESERGLHCFFRAGEVIAGLKEINAKERSNFYRMNWRTNWIRRMKIR